MLNNSEFQKLSEKFSKLDSINLLNVMIKKIFSKKIVLTSSFGSESIVILHMISKIDRSTPVIFINTGKLFPETLDYAKKIINLLKLNNILVLKPLNKDLKIKDPNENLYKKNPDECCKIRKVFPLEKIINNYDAWITGRKRIHGFEREFINKIEKSSTHIKINPLADWSLEKINKYIKKNNLPEHPLISKGYKSIGCFTCTNKVIYNESIRSGRWKNFKKKECGIHTFNPSI
tara:strand:+ start:3805 stop:4503 length:699 start_codon:yes stop_codon:yes gene_type:complete